ncbi:hypothetical protein BCD48_29645 [Pseudofrankia sp. BMG5.36]|nr:hypothetical protein BCD48_29645 [Pseudofrankia sp. BMG5.36]
MIRSVVVSAPGWSGRDGWTWRARCGVVLSGAAVVGQHDARVPFAEDQYAVGSSARMVRTNLSAGGRLPEEIG